MYAFTKMFLSDAKQISDKMNTDEYEIHLKSCTLYFPLRSSAAISVKDSNGTFVSTLSLLLFNVSVQHSGPFQFIHLDFEYKTKLGVNATHLILCYINASKDRA